MFGPAPPTGLRSPARRLASLALALVVSIASVAPVVPMTMGESGHDMPCCAQPTGCHAAALSGVCCRPAAPESAPASAPAVAAGAPPAVAVPAWASIQPLPDSARREAARAFASLLLTLTHDPPFLLNASFLI